MAMFPAITRVSSRLAGAPKEDTEWLVPVVDQYYTHVGPSPIRWADDITPAHDSALLCGLNAHNAEMLSV